MTERMIGVGIAIALLLLVGGIAGYVIGWSRGLKAGSQIGQQFVIGTLDTSTKFMRIINALSRELRRRGVDPEPIVNAERERNGNGQTTNVRERQ